MHINILFAWFFADCKWINRYRGFEINEFWYIMYYILCYQQYITIFLPGILKMKLSQICSKDTNQVLLSLCVDNFYQYL